MWSATRSGENGSAALSSSLSPRVETPSRPTATRFSANSVCTMAISSSASDPGRMKWCSSATRAVSVRRGSMTTSRPPRARRSFRRRSMPAAVMMLPLETSGFAPMQRKKCARSTSGTGMSAWCPNISSATSMCGSWSALVAEKRIFVRRTPRSTPAPRSAWPLWAVGLPR